MSEVHVRLSEPRYFFVGHFDPATLVWRPNIGYPRLQSFRCLDAFIVEGLLAQHSPEVRRHVELRDGILEVRWEPCPVLEEFVYRLANEEQCLIVEKPFYVYPEFYVSYPESAKKVQQQAAEAVMAELKSRACRAGEEVPIPITHKTLLVWDEPEIAELLARFLAQRGYQSKILWEGKPAVSVARAYQPDLILLRYNALPDVLGAEVCKELKLDPDTRHIPVILASTIGFPEENRAWKHDLGADFYLDMPFDWEQFDMAIKKFLPPKPV